MNDPYLQISKNLKNSAPPHLTFSNNTQQHLFQQQQLQQDNLTSQLLNNYYLKYVLNLLRAEI